MRTKLFSMITAITMIFAFGAITACSDDDGGEICDDGIDNDGDGAIDCADILCESHASCQSVCGDGVAEGAELCDGADVGIDSCTSEGFDAGDLVCNATCDGFDTAGCYDVTCGDDVAEGTEECDGADLDMTTCQDLGYTYGDLDCTGTCTFDDSGCYDESICADVTLTASGSFGVQGGDSQGGAYDWFYQEMVTLGTADTYLLAIELYGDFVTGGIVTGAHTLGTGADDNYETCAYCVLLRRCIDSSCSDVDAVFFANGGTLQLDTLSPADTGPLQGSLSSISWAEVDVDASYHSTEIPGGECFNLTADHTVDATVDSY